jgi:KDO2-lipid IV(A) lauroyltransferase
MRGPTDAGQQPTACGAKVVERWMRFLSHIPTAAIETAGRGLGQLAFWLDRRHRRIVQQNIAFVFPYMSSVQVRALGRHVFHHFGMMLLETLQAPFLSQKQLLERFQIENQHILMEAMDHPRGCMIYSAHLGNWELGLLALAANLGRPILTVAKPIKLRIAHHFLTILRSRFGNQVIFKKGALPQMMKTLRAGRTVAVLIDQGVRRTEAVEVKFFGQKTMATPAAALLSLRCRMPVIPMFCVRDCNGHYIVKVEHPIHFERTGDLRNDIQACTQLLIDSLEAPIRSCPEQWFWFHKRWKRTHPGLYPEYQVLRWRKRIKKGRAV